MNLSNGVQSFALAVILAGATAYLAISLVSLASDAIKVGASTAPDGTYVQLELGDGPYDFDYVWNWDFGDDTAVSNDVDWGFRFIFGNEASVDYVKDRLDGFGNDPDIDPTLNDDFEGIGNMHAYLDDGPEQGGSSLWNPDNGIKYLRDCDWNEGHMRVYGRNDHSNYSLGLGNYVIATIHEDSEDLPYLGYGANVTCDNEFRSFEEHEDWWLNRIRDNLAASPYNWVVTEDAINWNNGAGTAADPVDINVGGDEQLYYSDGWGAFISVSGND